MRRCKGAEVPISKRCGRYRGRDRVALGSAQKLVVSEYKHFILPDWTSKAGTALVLIERRGSETLTLGPRTRNLLAEWIGRKGGLVHIGPPCRSVHLVGPRLRDVLCDHSR